MRTRLLSALLLSAAFVVPSAALAAQPDRCPGTPLVATPGEANVYLHENLGAPGQIAKATGIPANEWAAAYNGARKSVCPPPGQQP